MLRLVYTSSAAFDFSEGDLISLLMTSRANNRRDKVTGLLLHDDGRFLQILEGPASAVDLKFDHISADPRHRKISVVLRDEIDERTFAKWTMGYKFLSDPVVQEIPGYNAFFSGGPVPGDDDVRDLLERFRDDTELSGPRGS